jgi:hypothetical protein
MALLLVACGGEDPTPTPEPVVEEAAPEPTEVPEEPTEVPEEPALEPAEEPEEEEAAPTEEPAEEPTPEPEPVSNCEVGYEGETITVYQSAGLTGPLSQILGQGFINGSKDAVAAINASGGVCGAEFVIRLEDSQYDPNQELEIYETFRAEDPKPMFLLTYGSGAAIVLKDRTIEDNIVNITAGLNAQSFYVPRNGRTDIKPEGAGDDIIVGAIGWDNAFGAGATTPEALAFAESLGVTVLPLEVQEVSPTADVTGQLQNLLLGGANVIWTQSLSFGPAQVIGTLHGLGAWNSAVVAGVNWAINTDVVYILGENAAAMHGFYGVFPYKWWNDTDEPGVQEALANFEAGGYPAPDMAVGYLLSHGSIYALRDILVNAINNVSFENLDGAAFFDSMQELGVISANGLFELDVRGENRAPGMAQIRQAQMNADGQIEFVVIEDFFQLPDTRPPAE